MILVLAAGILVLEVLYSFLMFKRRVLREMNQKYLNKVGLGMIDWQQDQQATFSAER